MFVYLAILSLLIYLIVKYDIQGNTKGKEAWINIFMVLLILLAGLRYHIGTDTVHYESWFENAPELSDIFRDADLWSQPLFILLLSIVKTYTGSYIAFQFAHAIIFNTLLFRFLKRATDKTFTVLFFILCVSWWNLSFEVLRESLCVAIYLNALLCLKDRKLLQYILLGVIMMGFHRFSFIMVAITPFIAFVKTRISLPVVFILTIFLFFNESLINFIDFISSTMMEGAAAAKISHYVTYEGSDGISHYNFWGLLQILLMSFALPMITIIYNQSDEDKKYFNRILVLVLIFGIMQTKLVIFYRLLNYINIILIICFVNVLYHSNIAKPIVRIGLHTLVLLYLYFGIHLFYRPSHLEYRSGINYNCVYIPYKTVFQEPDPTREALIN